MTKWPETQSARRQGRDGGYFFVFYFILLFQSKKRIVMMAESPREALREREREALRRRAPTLPFHAYHTDSSNIDDSYLGIN